MIERLNETSNLIMNVSGTKILGQNVERIENKNKLSLMERAKERTLMRISLRDKIRNEEIRRRTKVVNLIEELKVLNGDGLGM